MPQDIRFYDDGKGNVRQVASDKVDRFKSMFPDAKEAGENQLTEIESKRATQNEQQRLESSDINVSIPTVEKADITLSDNQNPFSRKGMKGAIDISNAHHRSDPDVQFRAKYGAYKDNPELHRDEDAPEMVERRKKQPWYSYIGGGNAVVNATKQNQYGEENQEGTTKTRQSQDYLSTRASKDDKHREADMLSDFLTNTQSGRDAVKYDKDVTKYFEELKPIVEKQRIALQQQVNDVNEKRKIYGRKARAANLIIQDEEKRQQDTSYSPTWDRKLDVERAQQEYKENYEALVALPEPNDVTKAQEALTSLKNMKEALNDRDKSAVQQYLGEIKRNASKELVDAITFGTKGMIEDVAGVKGGPVTDKVMETTQMFANINENLMKDQRSIAQDIAAGSMQTTGFILQMALTSGLAKGIVGAGGKVLSKLFTPTTREIARRVAFEAGGKAVSVAGREISEVFVQAFLMPSTLASALERNAANPGHFLNSWAAAYKSALVEVGSERIGDFIPMGKFKSPLVNKVMQATHLNNIPVEFLEEQIGTLGHIALGTGEGEWSDFTDKRNQLVTLGVVTASGMPYLAIESGGYAAGKYQVVKQKYEIGKSYKSNVKEMQAEFGEEADDIMSVIESSMDSMKDDLTAIQTLTLAIANTEGLNKEQQNTVFTFAMAATAKKGLERAKQEAKESAKQANAETLRGYVNESTGTVTLVNVAGMDAPVAVQGDIVFTEDGKIDTHNWGVLYYTDNNGKKQVVNPQFVDLVESTPANQVEEALNQTSEQEIENEYANDEVRAYEAGEVIRYAVNEQQSIVGTIQGVDNNGNYIVYVDGFGEATIEPRMIVPEDNLKGVQNGAMVEYTNDKGELVVGEVQDMISLRNAGLVMIDGQEVQTQNIIGVEGTTEAENATIEEETTQQEAEEVEVTPEQQAEQEKETFIQSLPVNNKGEIDQKQMTTAQTMQYFEYQYGVDETLKAAEQQIKNKEGQLKAAQTRLNSDPFNIAKREKVSEIQSELEEYKAYVFDKKKAKSQEIADTSTSSIAEEQAKQEQRRAEAEAQRQAEQSDIEALKGIPDVTVDKAKDARARGYRSVNGERVNRQEASTPTTFTEAQRKFSDKESVPVKRTIVEAGTLQPSHKNGVKNDNFFITEAQPKPRTDDASQHAAESIASNINPQEITGGVTAYTGAPIVNSHGEVIQGNNRVTGLQLMHENRKEQAQKYKQHLKENAADYGMTAEQVDAMTNPVAVDVAEVSDADAIRLGQLSQQDTESGGIQRVPAKQTSVALGDNMGRFAQILFESSNEDAISTVIEKNGRKAIDYLRQKGVINPTQYQSAFDKDGNITPEAKKDLQDIASQMLFEGANENIEQMFDALPNKAQKAILQTIHRDAKSPKSERIVKELQQAIEAYYHLQGHDDFANATDYKSATIAAIAAKNSTVMFNSESDLPLQKYSNFAMEMAVLFKTDTQKELRQRFNSLYDNIQGVGGDVFNAAEKLSLVEAIKKHFNNIDYVSDGQTKRTDVAGDSKTSGKGRQEGAGEAASGERTETGGKPTDSGAGTNTDNKQSGKTNPNLTQEREITKAIQELSAKLNTPFTIYNSAKEIPESEHKARQSKAKAWYIPSTGEVFINAFNATSVQDVRVSIFHEVVAHKGMRDMLGKEKHAELMNSIFDALPKQIQDALFEKYKSKEIAADEYVAYLAENEKNLTPQEKGTWESIKQAVIDFIENHIGIKLTEQNVDDVIRGLLVESKKRLENKGKPVNLVEVAKESVEKGKVDKAAKEVNTNPTEAQKEAGNYKKGHIKVAGFDITIENPKNTDRKGVDKDGKEWSVKMNNHYGYFKRTKGKDGDHIDVFVGDNLQGEKVFVVDQVDEDGAFDEHKVMLGFDSVKQAQEAYLSNYEDGWNGLKDITETTVEDFKKWIDVDTKKSKAFADYKENQTAQQYGSQNKIISQDQYNELREKLKNKLNNLNIGFDPEVFSLGAQMAAYHIEAGAVKFKDFAQRMIADVGEVVKPYLKSFYEGARLTPGFENLSKQMDAHRDVVNADVNDIGETGASIPNKSKTNGYQIYETDVKTKEGVKKFYAVPTIENKNNGKSRFGDSLHQTLEEAINQTKENVQQEADIAEQNKKEQESKKKDQQEAREKAERNKGKTPAQIMQEARAEKTLGKQYNYDEYGVLTRKEYIDKISSEGRKVEAREVEDGTAINKLKQERDRLRMSAPPFNKNHPKTKRLNEIIEILNSKDKLPKKLDYIVYAKNGKSFLEVTKTEYDYYNTIKPKKKDTPINLVELSTQVAAKEKLKQEEKRKEQPAEKIEDFGEVIEGAKKHTYQRIETTETDMQSQPLSKTFPKPNYSKLVEDGVLTKKGAMVLKHAYEALPSKPRKKFRVAAWMREVEKLIATYNSLIENKDVGDTLHDNLMKIDSFDSDYSTFVEIQEAFGFPENDVSMGAYRVIPPNRTQRSTGIDKQWLIVKGNSIHGKADSAEGIVRVFNQMVDKNKKKGVALSIYRDTKTNKYFIGRKTGGGIARLVEGLTREEVTRMYKEDMPKLQEMWEARKVKPEERRKENRKRVGTDYRKGKDVTPEQFGEAFGFRGVQFGNWVNSAERQDALNDAYDAFMDLSNAIGVSPRALSLAGELGMAFGARGSGNAMAHYESGKVVINLTKTKGAGSLAHEWWHAMDSYFSRMRGEKQGFLTESPRQRVVGAKDGKAVYEQKIRTEMHDAFLEVMNAINNSDLPKRSKELDKSRSKAYWATQLEMSARAFEGYIIDKLGETGEQNDYLANFKDTGEWASSSAFDMKNYPYPTVDENAAINEAFESLFDAMQEKEEDGKQILYRDNQDFRDAHTSPTMGHETLEEATDESGDVSLSEVITGKQELVPDDFFDTRKGRLKNGSVGYMGAIRYGFNTKSGTETFDAIKALQEKVKKGISPTKIKARAYRAVPNKVEVNELIDRDWVTLSKDYAEKHGLARFGEGEYKIIEQDVPVNKLWWDGNNPNEWGYDVEENIRYRIVEDSNQQEIEEERNKYNGQSYMLVGDKVNYTIYTPTESADSYSESGEQTIDFSEAYANVDDLTDKNNSNYSGIIYGLNAVDVEVDLEDVKSKMGYEEDIYDGDIDSFLEEVMSEYVVQTDDFKELDTRFIHRYKSELDNQGTDEMIDDVMESLRTETGANIKKYSSFFVDRDGNMTNEAFDRQNEDLENISVTMRIGNHTHNPSNGRNDLNVLIADKDETRGAFRGARTDLEFSSDYTVDEIAQEIKDYWQSFARQEYEDYRESDIRYRETDRPQFSDAIETVVDRFVDRVALKENEFQKDVPNLKELVLSNDVKDYGMYDKYEIVSVSNPVINIHNLNNSIYGLGVELKPLNDLHSQALLNFDGDTGHLNQEKVKEFRNKFEGAIQPYETALLKTKHFATEAAQREIMDIIKDIDHAKDYYGRLAKDHNVLRSENAPRFRDAESIPELADMVGSDMTEEARKEYDKKYNSFASRFREAWEDSYLPVKQFQDLLEKNGLKIEEHNDYYKQTTHVPGKNDFQLEHYKKTYQHPITLAVNALQEKGLTYREIENYVFAKHGIERNEFMRRDEAKTYANAIRQRAEIKAKQEQRSIDNKLLDETEYEKQTNKIERAKQKKLQESDVVEERKYQELQGKDYAGLTQLMEEVNPEGVEQGRTLQDMAEEYNKDFEGKAGEKLINSLWGKIKKATDFTLDNHYKTGGVSRDVYLELKGRYQNFVPLRGHDQEVAEDRWDYTQGNMGEFYSGAIIKAQGRRSRAESPFAYIGQMAHSSIMRGNKNTLNQALLRLAHKDKSGLMDVKRTWYVNKGTLENPVWEAEAAEFSDNIDTYLQNQIDFEKRMKEMQEIGMAAQSSKHLNIGGLFIKPKQAEQHEVQVDQNGVHYTIYINANPAIARAINGDNKKSIAKGMGFIGNVTRAMAMNFTTRNPLFIARNFSRDYIFANTMLMVKEDATYTARFNKNMPLAFAALTRQKRGTLDLNNETDAYVYEFMMNGGRTGFSHIFELKRAAKALEKEARKGDKKSALDYGRVALGAIDVVNDVVENATRLSTYMASRQAGRSITQSVHDAKNVTVNFNQKGAGSSIGNNSFERFMLSAAGWVRPLYLFTNAAVQALSNVGKATKKHPVKMGTAITSFALMGFLSPIIAGMIGGDDEEDDFMKMSDWDRQNNWCIPVGSGYIKIPLPHEMRVFHRLGDNIYQASTGRKDTLETVLDMVFALSDLVPMNPLGAADASWAELMPDFIKPYLQHHATNTSFMGTRIYNEWANPYAPGYTKVSTNKKGEAYAPAFLIELYKHLDHLTGGDGVKKGVISLNPDVTNHYMRGWFGGLWTIAEQSIDIGYKATEWSKTGELNLKVRETPLSSFYSDKNDLNVSSGATGQRYYDIMKDVNEARRRSKGYVTKVRDGDMSIHELTKKMEELDMPKVNALYERVKEVKAMEGRLKDLEGKEQKDLEKEIFEKKKMVVEMK